MKVSINPGTERRGLVFKKEWFTVNFIVTLSEEEKAQATAAGILDHHMIAVPFGDGAISDFYVSSFVEPHDWKAAFPNQIEAVEWQNELKRVLKALKDTLEGLDQASGAEEFEL